MGHTPGRDKGRLERLLTVAKVRPGPDGAEVLFLESARIYRLLRNNPAYDDALRQLDAATGSGRLVLVRFVEPNSEIIAVVQKV